ncbi:sensor histidine kinase [Sphingobacterium paludis]|uniref:histidine kinase n=1 Tax=Sphingobacterium paludis TaxID=1476465 RepID=A0A4V3E0Z7_9SPHI|nr:HAMP domain-containing sensor histidine kinase [Sphingobacterium paludis]TDS10410.1 two-component system phosphate regulon sensor histidine kinase PhoR [Sphingobacterium paludis]
MKKRSITLIIWLMSIALLGVMAMQYYFVRESYKQKSQLFDEAVTASLLTVASKIEKREVYDFVKEQQKIDREKYRKEQAKQKTLAKQLALQKRIEELRIQQYELEQKFKDEEDLLRSRYPLIAYIENSFYETYIKRTRYNDFVTIRILPGEIDRDIQNNVVEVYATKKIPMIPAKDDSTRYLAFLNSYNDINWVVRVLPPRGDLKIAFRIHALEQELALNTAQTLIDSVAVMGGKNKELVTSVAAAEELSKRPFRDRVNFAYLKNEMENELSKRDIYAPFNLEVRDDRSLLVYETWREKEGAKSAARANYSTRLFENDLGRSPGRVTVYFPNKPSIIRDNISYLLLPMIALLALLIGAFAYTLSIIFKQKKISAMKTDFMNNMTHEFKTPVATIMIASESLKDPEISSDERRVNRLANIIYDENVRLGNHIERVLNIARLEKENLKIEKVNVHINEVVSGVLDSMALQLQKANGSLATNMAAVNDLVTGDELHLSNVFFNLVDNAIKYSKDAPDITVKTFNLKNNIVITIADKGMGMTKDQKEKIFDQFYRIPTGNVHNVKGFGLGLSYVNDIVKRLNGKIQVKSEKDKGTIFELSFPLKGANLNGA